MIALIQPQEVSATRSPILFCAQPAETIEAPARTARRIERILLSGELKPYESEPTISKINRLSAAIEIGGQREKISE